MLIRAAVHVLQLIGPADLVQELEDFGQLDEKLQGQPQQLQE